MSDLFTNKIAAAVLTTGLALLGLNQAGEYFFKKHDPEKPGYLVEVADADHGGADDKDKWVPPVDYGVLLAAADVEAGKKKAAACATCHKFEKGAGALQGPALYDVVGRDAASVPGFKYSTAMAEHPGDWDYASLDHFLTSPKKYIPGTAMNFAGLAKEKDRMNLIAYLRSLSDSPHPLPAPLPPEAFQPPAEDATEVAHTEEGAAATETPGTEEAPVEGAVNEADAAAPQTEDAPAETEAAPGDAAGIEGETFTAEVDGFKLVGAADGVEARLLGFITSGKEPCKEAACWYTFDRLTFATGSSQLDMERSRDQLTNIFHILKAHPSVALKIGGYTDNTGDPATNLALSQQRAEAVTAALVEMGVDVARLDPEGYGSEHPVASNDTPEGRAQNRRIDLRVKSL